jgi:hypothetical protein
MPSFKAAKVSLLLLLACVAFPACAQAPKPVIPTQVQPADKHDIYQSYSEMLEKAGKIDLTQEQFSRIRTGYFRVITPAMNTSPEFAKTMGQTLVTYPLAFLRSKPFYRPTITKLLHSKDMLNRLLGYMTVASAGDSSFNDVLWKASTTETDHDALFWVGTALLYLKDQHTSQLFDFLVKNEDFGDAHMLPMMLDQNKQSLQQTCYAKVSSPNIKAKALAVQLLATTGLNPQTDKAIRQAFVSMDGPAKGYAISAMKTLRMGNLKEMLLPTLQDKQLRGVAIAALMNSPTAEDGTCPDSLLIGNGEVPADILGAYLSSDNPENVRKFLILVRDRPIPSKIEYRLMFSQSSLLASDQVFDQLKDTIRRTKNRQIVPYLSLSLAKRNDPESSSLRVPITK